MTGEHTKANDLYWREIFENSTEPMLVIDQAGRVYEAVRILGTRTILVGIKPHLAQSLVHIGASLENIPTYATLEQGLRAAMARQA